MQCRVEEQVIANTITTFTIGHTGGDKQGGTRLQCVLIQTNLKAKENQGKEERNGAQQKI